MYNAAVNQLWFGSCISCKGAAKSELTDS